MIELNSLDVLKARETKFLAPHFSTIKISDSERYDSNIVGWIKAKLNGRFCIANYPSIDNDNKFKNTTIVGFEDEKELTYFMLGCPYLRRN